MDKRTMLYLILAVAVVSLVIGAVTMYAIETEKPFPPANSPDWSVNFDVNPGPTPPGEGLPVPTLDED